MTTRAPEMRNASGWCREKREREAQSISMEAERSVRSPVANRSAMNLCVGYRGVVIWEGIPRERERERRRNRWIRQTDRQTERWVGRWMDGWIEKRHTNGQRERVRESE